MKNIRERIQDLFRQSLFRSNADKRITENSLLTQIARFYPDTFSFLERRYGIKGDKIIHAMTLKELVDKFALPSAQILFMEIQISARGRHIRQISAHEANSLLLSPSTCSVLDVREEWERNIAELPSSEPLSPSLLDRILNEWEKDRPILLYCHFGVRSLDAATFLSDRGFTNLYVLQGGIDAWALHVDPKVPRYEGSFC